MIDLDKVKKVVINLERRPDRLKRFNDEMKFNTVCYIVNRKFAEMVLRWEESNLKAIDQYYYEDIFGKLKCFAPSLPIVTQQVGFSDINKTTDNNHYLITYNWNLYTKNKLDVSYYDINYCDKLKHS
jgi:hypothetical protein